MTIKNDFKYRAFGVTNLCDNGHQLPFFDYDINDLTLVMYELSRIQFKHKLSKIYILKSTHGYNAFSLDKLTKEEIEKLYNDCKEMDSLFIAYSKKRCYATLRMGLDKELIGSIASSFNIYSKSLSHKNFFNEIMDFNITDNINFDNGNFIRIVSFLSNKNGILRSVLND